jgi:hypothetical protein
MKSLIKQLVYFNEFKEIVSIFGQTEVGTDEVDIEALSEYLSSSCKCAGKFTEWA